MHQELARRTDTLIRLIEKENEEEEERLPAAKRGPKAGPGSRKRAGSVTAASSGAATSAGGDAGDDLQGEVGRARKSARTSSVGVPGRK